MGWKLGRWDAAEGFKRRAGRVNLSSFQGPSRGYEHQGVVDYSFTDVPMVFTCVTRIARRLRVFPRRVVGYDGTFMPESKKPMWVEDPNPLMSGPDLITSTAISLLLEGEAFLFPIRGNSGRVAMVGVANPQLVTNTTYADRVEWWVNGERTDMEFLHLKDVALPGRIRGARRVGAYKRPADVSVGSLKYTQQHLARGGAYQIVIRSDKGRGTQSAESREALKQSLKDYHAGWRNAYNPLVLPPDIIAEPLNPKMLNADNGFVNLMSATDAQIAVGFGFDPMDVGIGVENASRTYTNEPSRIHRLHKDAIEPIQRVIEEGLSEFLPKGQKFVLDEREWLVGGPHDRADLVDKMALTNERMVKLGAGMPFSAEEMRETAGFRGPPPEMPEQAALAAPPAGLPAPAASMGDEDDNEDDETE